MNGIELSRAFYRKNGERMLKEKFGGIMDKIAVGVCGSGSDSFGFDDEISRDHDFEAGFIVFLPGEDVVSRRDEFLLERAYNALSSEFNGVVRSNISPVGGNRRGVIRYADFFESKTGFPDGNLTDEAWLRIPENYLFEAVCGEIFFDGLGEVTAIREKLRRMPEDAVLKRLAGNFLIINQSGQYNYARCVKRGESGAAQLALFEFVKAAINCAFLLENEYCPYYKWAFRALKNLPLGKSIASSLEMLISTDNSPGNFALKKAEIERVCGVLIKEATEKKRLQNVKESDTERLAYMLNDRISSANIRNLDIFYCV